jgi:hypothetical protein
VTCCAVDRENAAFYEGVARNELRAGDLELGLHLLDVADFYASPSPATTCERITLLRAAMGRLSEEANR